MTAIMDPNETLKLLHETASDIFEAVDRGCSFADLTEEAETMATLFNSLDEWIRKGGFLPTPWQRTQKRSQA